MIEDKKFQEMYIMADHIRSALAVTANDSEIFKDQYDKDLQLKAIMCGSFQFLFTNARKFNADIPMFRAMFNDLADAYEREVTSDEFAESNKDKLTNG
jgi:hypothetical protein